MSQGQFRMIADNLDPEIIAEKTIELVNTWFKEAGIKQNEVQKKMFFSHIKAMIHRAKTLEKLPEVDPTLFDEISEESMLLAFKTIELFDTLPAAEAYLLAVHYEVARTNEE